MATEEQKDFYFTQLLNLDRIEMNFSAIDSSRIADLKRIAQKNHPGMGYAWSLYYLITGELLPIEIPFYS